jgi:CheY-like chemotaxis protein
MLVSLGYDVVACTSVQDALAVFQADADRFALVITDQTMPVMTGVTLTHELRRIRSDIPIILCTGYSHVVNAETAAAQGIDAFLLKPIALYDLARTVHQVLQQRASLVK